MKPEQISQVADYVRTLSGNKPEVADNVALGAKIFADNCAMCHGKDGKGNIEIGAPNLTTKIWLYGPTKADISIASKSAAAMSCLRGTDASTKTRSRRSPSMCIVWVAVYEPRGRRA